MPANATSYWPRPRKTSPAIAARVGAGTLHGAGKIGETVGKAIGKYQMGKHFRRDITDTTFTYRRDTARIDTEAKLDGIYVLRTSVEADTLDPAASSKATRTSPTSNATSASSRPTTWTCAPSTTASRTGSKPTC